MANPTLTIFANFRLDSEERFLRMKDSFLSFKDIDAERWIINIRGRHKVEAGRFLEAQLGSRLALYQLESPEGWFHDSRIMAATIETEYVFFWVEDHLCLRPDKISPTLREMQEKDLDLLTYSFCHKGQARAYYGNDDIVPGEELDWFEHTVSNNPVIQRNIEGGVRLVSCISIMKRSLFNKVLFENKKFIWPKETPFDFEVSPTETQFLPLKRGLPKHELFASMDDDNAVPGTSLISRGLYPDRVRGPRLTATASEPQSATGTPPTASHPLIVLINGYRVGQPTLPTGTAYVAQALENAEIHYEVCDVNITPDEQIVEVIKKQNPAYIGLGTMTFEVGKNYRLLQTLKKALPGVVVILGGPHAIAAGRDIFQECPAVDFVIRGEGEEALVGLLQGVSLKDIPGLLSRDPRLDGTAYEPLQIDHISFPKYRRFDLGKYGTTMNLASSRGCVYSCTFCGAPKFLGKKWRAFSSGRMIEEFEYWYARGYRNFYFTDSLFALDRRRLVEFCSHVAGTGYKDVSFTADGARADHLTRDVLEQLKQASFTTLILGVESVHDRTLEFFRKNETFAQIDAALSIADSLDFDIIVYLIIGAPTESYNDALDSLRYPLKYKNIISAVVSKLMPIKGTPYYDYALEHGLVDNPDLCYPKHEVSGYNAKADSHTPVEKIWTELSTEITDLSRFLETRSEIRSYLRAQGIVHFDVEQLNTLTKQHLDSLSGTQPDAGGDHSPKLSAITSQRDGDDLIRRLMAANITVEKFQVDVEDFVAWLEDFRDIYDSYSPLGDVAIEKCLEHYLSFKVLQLQQGQVYIDIAASASSWADCLRERGAEAYSLDLKYPEGIHGNRIGANAAATGLPAGSVDAMSLQCAFETFKGDFDKLFIRESNRILRDGGKVVITPLYLDTQHFILSGKNVDISEAPLDEGAIRVWREDDYDEDFSRHYSPEALASRISSDLEGMSAKVLYIDNLDRLRERFPGQRIYCDFTLYLAKRPASIVAEGDENLTRIYDEDFYQEQKDASYRSAECVVPLLLNVFEPRSVIDIGCGAGGGLHVFPRNGVHDIRGYDVNNLRASTYFVDKKHIRTGIDLSSSSLAIEGRADLLICLEVAEHLPAEHADRFVATLTNASQAIVFSAALPGQTGVNHVNEQPPWYWREKFNRLGYVEIDFIRPQILDNENVCWWYRQNMTCFVRPELLAARPKLGEMANRYGQRQNEHKLTVINEWVLQNILNGDHGTCVQAPPQQERTPFLSVIIPTRNRAALLHNTLHSLTLQTYPSACWEVIVVDNGSTDCTADVCRHFARRVINFKRIEEPRPGLHNGRHAGLCAARGEIVVFADDDIEAFPTWLEGVAESFADPGVAMVGGKILPKFETAPPAWVEQLKGLTESGWYLGWYSILDFGDSAREIPHEYVWGCNFSIRKEVLEKIGGFHPDALPQELIKYRGDGETAVSFAVRDLGLKAVYNPKAGVNHMVSAERLTPDYIYRRAFNQGISNSYASIRQTRALSPPMTYAPATGILETVERGMVDGFNYHQQRVQSDKGLQEWVFRSNYLGDAGGLPPVAPPFQPYLKRKNVEGVAFDFWIGDEDGREWYDLQCGDPDWMELRFLRDNLIAEGDVILECGGHHGCTAIVLSRWVGHTGKVITFEALPANCDIIRKNIEQNGIDNIQLERKAVGAQKGAITVTSSSNSSVSLSGGGIQVDMVSLDMYEHLHPTLLKIDVEGFEVQVLQGAQKILARRPKLAIEVHTDSLQDYGASVEDIFRLIGIDGYRVWIQWEDGQQPEEYVAGTPITKRVHLFCVPR